MDLFRLAVLSYELYLSDEHAERTGEHQVRLRLALSVSIPTCLLEAVPPNKLESILIRGLSSRNHT